MDSEVILSTFVNLYPCKYVGKIVYYLETIAAIGIRVGLTIQINELMKLNEYQSQGHYLTLAKGYSDFKIKFCFSQKLLSHLKPNFI